MNNLRNKFKDDYQTLKDLPDYERAEVIAEEMFKGVKDKEGRPYIEHLHFVSEAQPTESGKIVGLLHDLIEDTDTTLLELQEVGFSDKILYSLILLTKVKGTPYSEYIDKILASGDEIALRVKEADMRNNMDPERIARLAPEYQEKFNLKYPPQYEKIKNKIGEIENDRHKVNTRK
ncbi:MAG: phosphohydrolase [Bacilli bacterium]|nr:phosphohydrolase [Bacilli bacterium]